MQFTCPCCRARISVDTTFQDEAAREFFRLVLPLGALGAPLVTYLGFFRPIKQATLAWDRALRLAREVLELTNDRSVLAAALNEACASLDAKRAEPGWKPLTGHNYLKRVLESVAARADVRGAIEPDRAARVPATKAGRGLAELEKRKHER